MFNYFFILELTGDTAVSGSLLGDLCELESRYVCLYEISPCTDVTQEGIFRRSGKMTRQQELRNLLNSRAPLILNDGRFSVHDGASVLKNVLAQLPECLLTEAHYPAHCQIAGNKQSL